MKHFIVKIKYTAPISEIEKVVAEHREFLQTGYDNEMLLCSGPIEPRTGGIIIARAESLNVLQEFFIHDPYNINQVADYKFIEFNPVKSQEFLIPWLS